jgi:hypothetical protein
VVETGDAWAALDALRARGADRLDPVRWACTEALARRMARWQGPVRQRLEARLRQLLACWQGELDGDAVRPLPTGAAAPPPPPGAAALAALAAWIRPLPPPANRRAAAPDGSTTELRALRRFRGEWARLRAEQRLAGALAQVPAKAGPLHSTGLALRAVQLMRALSPGYLQHFVVHVDALLWLEAATGDGALPLPSPVRTGGDRRQRRRTGR